MSTTAYYEVLSRIQRLTPADQLRLLEELAALVRRQVHEPGSAKHLRIAGFGQRNLARR